MSEEPMLNGDGGIGVVYPLKRSRGSRVLFVPIFDGPVDAAAGSVIVVGVLTGAIAGGAEVPSWEVDGGPGRLIVKGYG